MTDSPACLMPDVDLQEIVGTFGLRPGMRGLVVVGPGCRVSPSAVTEFATTSRYPVLADAPSNLRRPPTVNLVSEADLLLGNSRWSSLRAEVMIHLGGTPIASVVRDFLAEQRCPVLRFDEHLSLGHHPWPATVQVRDASAEMLCALGSAVAVGDAEWLEIWCEGSAFARTRIETSVRELPWGEAVVASMVCNARGVDLLHLANSMSIRHGNMLCAPTERAQRIFANRGVNGIDGTVGTFIGELLGCGGSGMLLVGDQAMLHDLPALTAARDARLRGTIVVVNNGGGAIFDLMACSRFAGYYETMRNPAGIGFAELAVSFGLDARRVASQDELAAALDWSLASPGVQVIEAAVPSGSMKRDIDALRRSLLG
jgi:2-succinyl-5-enolpyruvyl-6-hydroxy-3-cyclohexene-1-carboxylate synthase